MRDIEVEPVSVICGVLGAIIVVAAGLHLVRLSRLAEAEPAPSA
jgi:hypothetical protein